MTKITFDEYEELSVPVIAAEEPNISLYDDGRLSVCTCEHLGGDKPLASWKIPREILGAALNEIFNRISPMCVKLIESSAGGRMIYDVLVGRIISDYLETNRGEIVKVIKAENFDSWFGNGETPSEIEERVKERFEYDKERDQYAYFPDKPSMYLRKAEDLYDMM